MIAAILEEASSEADQRNDELLLRLFEQLRDCDLGSRCEYCHFKYDYVFFKLHGRRLKKRLDMETLEPRSSILERLKRARTLSEAAHQKMSESACLCGSATWNRIVQKLSCGRQRIVKG